MNLLLAYLCLASSLVAAEPAAKPTYTHAVLIRVEGVIGPHFQRYLHRKLDVAKEEGADLVIVEIDSPGGRVGETMEIAESLKDINWAHTVAFVPREAISGAAIISLGCDEILMTRDARWGDAGVIVFGEDSLFRFAPEKAVSYLTDFLRSLSVAKGRPPALAEALVDKDLKVYLAKNVKTGKITYISDRDVKAAADDWKILKTVAASGGGRFLAITGDEAADLGIANGLINFRDDIKQRYGLSELHVIVPTGTDLAIDLLNSGWATALLLILGLIGLYVEFMAPGTGAGGLIAAACFTILFWSHFLGGTAGWLQVVLFLLGVAFLAVELFLLPGTMAPGLAGVLLILVSLVMVTQGFLVPENARQMQTFAHTLFILLGSLAAFVVAAVFITRRFGSLPFFRQLALAPPDADGPPQAAGLTDDAATGAQPFHVGDIGVAHTALRPGGKGRFGGQYVDVQTSGDFLARGTPIRIVRIAGNQIVVEAAEGEG